MRIASTSWHNEHEMRPGEGGQAPPSRVCARIFVKRAVMKAARQLTDTVGQYFRVASHQPGGIAPLLLRKRPTRRPFVPPNGIETEPRTIERRIASRLVAKSFNCSARQLIDRFRSNLTAFPAFRYIVPPTYVFYIKPLSGRDGQIAIVPTILVHVELFNSRIFLSFFFFSPPPR